MYTGKVLKRVYMGWGGVFNKGLVFFINSVVCGFFHVRGISPG